MGWGNVIHVLEMDFDEKHNGEVRFQISSFLRSYRQVLHKTLESNITANKMELVNACNVLRNKDI
jgi:hypothetical protein